MRFVEFSRKADRARTELPARTRLAVSRAIRNIAENPAPGAPGASGPRFIAPGDSVNSGRIVALVRIGARLIAITYQVRSVAGTVWILDIREVFVG